jgi:uncharacterized protein (TIGR03089 family)
MDITPPTTVPSAFAHAVVADPTRPLITFYDDATGERTELSGATMANWVAKTANLLVDGCALEPASVVAVRLPAHWLTAAVLLGCWSAGLAVDFDGTGAPLAAVSFVAADRLSELAADESFVALTAGGVETFGLALAPLAGPIHPPPHDGVLDYVLEVRRHGDHFSALVPGGRESVAIAEEPPTTHGDLIAAAAVRAERGGLGPGARVLVDGDVYPDPLDWLVTPLVARASVVLCRHLDNSKLQSRLVAERATVWP